MIKDGKIKILDFEYSFQQNDNFSLDTTILVRELYAAPEAWRDEDYDP